MAFESLSDKLQNIFKNLRGKGKLSEADVKAALKEVKMALLEADVSFRIVKQFIKSVEARAVGEEVLESLTPGQMVIKIVNEELVKLMGSETVELQLNAGGLTTIMMIGLQGAGKTTTAAKIAAKIKSKGRKPLLVACDVYRPAAIDQLKINGERVGVEVYSLEGSKEPVQITKKAMEYAESNGFNVVIIDTAGRLHVDESMMDELATIKAAVTVDSSLLVVDAMTGQDAVNVADNFQKKVGIDGVILTKLDGDTRGGAALSIKAVTGSPILYAGMGEKLSDLEQFYPDRMASRILGMGDVLTLIEKAQANIDEAKAKEYEQKLRKAEFDYNDFLDQISQVKKMGGLGQMLSMLPGAGKLKGFSADDLDDSAFKTTEAIIHSMTLEERRRPELINMSRKKRIAAGAGVDINEVNRLCKQFDQMKKMMKQMTGAMGKKGRRGGGMPGGFGGMKLPF
ncbi:MAG: signal recognition particle protein [Lachnospiraceae bacterium]|nr:signal recognition particle protein [Lachnospiraceae bacterium]